jgi:hypothetical protein
MRHFIVGENSLPGNSNGKRQRMRKRLAIMVSGIALIVGLGTPVAAQAAAGHLQPTNTAAVHVAAATRLVSAATYIKVRPGGNLRITRDGKLATVRPDDLGSLEFCDPIWNDGVAMYGTVYGDAEFRLQPLSYYGSSGAPDFCEYYVGNDPDGNPLFEITDNDTGGCLAVDTANTTIKNDTMAACDLPYAWDLWYVIGPVGSYHSDSTYELESYDNGDCMYDDAAAGTPVTYNGVCSYDSVDHFTWFVWPLPTIIASRR